MLAQERLAPDGHPESCSGLLHLLRDDFPLRPALLGGLVPHQVNLWMGAAPSGTPLQAAWNCPVATFLLDACCCYDFVLGPALCTLALHLPALHGGAWSWQRSFPHGNFISTRTGTHQGIPYIMSF